MSIHCLDLFFISGLTVMARVSPRLTDVCIVALLCPPIFFDLNCCFISVRSNVMELRSSHKDAFVKKHGIKLGFMSAFLKASAYGLTDQPVVNAVIDGNEIVYRDYVDISVAVATPKVTLTHHCTNLVGLFGTRGQMWKRLFYTSFNFTVSFIIRSWLPPFRPIYR